MSRGDWLPRSNWAADEVAHGRLGLRRSRDGQLVLANCPFHALVDEQRDLVCGMNHDLLCGLVDGIGPEVPAARLAPAEGSCCVRLDTEQRAAKER